jgi:hypothetical protein
LFAGIRFEGVDGIEFQGFGGYLSALKEILRNEATLFLHFGESGQGAVEHALGAREAAREGCEEAAFNVNFDGIALNGPGLQLAEATYFPAVLSEFIDQKRFGGVDGLMFGHQRGTEAVVFCFVLVILDDFS